MTYSNSSTSTVWAYTTFTFEAGEYLIMFDWKCNGESCCDFLKAYVFPATGSVSAGSETVPSGSIQIGGTMNLSSSWQQKEELFTITTPGDYKLAFLWRNDYSAGSTPPAVVDNIVVVKNTCPRPTSLHSTSLTASSLDVEWVGGGTETSWVVSVSPDNNLTYNKYVNGTPHFSVSGLSPNSDYTVSVRGICGAGDTSLATTATFRTPCVALTTLPYTMGFETDDGVTQTGSATNTSFVDCWKRLNNATSYWGYPYVAQNSSNAHAGNRYLYWYPTTMTGTYGDYQVAVLPGVDTSLYSINGLRLKFWAKTMSSGFTPVLYIGVMTNPEDINSFVYVDTVEVSGNTETGGANTLWTEYMSDLTAYTSSGTYVAIRANRPTNTSMTFYMDDITLMRQPDCPRVTNIAATGIDSSSATITWTEVGTATSWEISVTPSIPNPPGILNTPTVNLTGLTTHTQYTVTITPVCPIEGGTSENRSIKFTTDCGFITSLPYSNGFEDEPYYLNGTTSYTDAFPFCWTRINDASGTYNYYPFVSTTSTYVHSGSKGMYWYTQYSSYSSSTNNNYANNMYMVLPGVDTSRYNIADLTLSFYAHGTNNAAPVVGVMTNPDDATTFTPVYTFAAGDITNAWNLFKVPLSSYTGTGIFIAVKMSRNSNTRTMYMDDIYLTNSWCEQTTAVAATADTDRVTLRWDAVEGATGYVVSLGTGNTQTVTDTFYTFTGLDAQTEYPYSVSTLCGTSTSMPVEGFIATLCTPLLSLPYSTGFEDATYISSNANMSRTFVDCWQRLNNGSVYFGYPNISNSTTASYVHTGSKCLYWYGSTVDSYGDYQCAVLPGFDTAQYPINTLRLSFWAYSNSNSRPVFYVGVMSDPYDIESFERVDSVDLQGMAGHNEFVVNFNTYTGSGRYVAIRADRPLSSSWSAYIDDITLEVIPACPRVEDLAASNISHNSATISWTEAGPATSWTVSVTPGNQTTTQSSTPSITLTGLSPQTEYTVTVTPVCPVEGGTSESLSLTFTTDCGPLTALPYTMGFETSDGCTTGSSTSTSFIPCWHRINNASTYVGYPFVSSGYNVHRTGSYGLNWYSYSGENYGDYLVAVLPAVDTSIYAINSLTLSFWAKYSNNSGYLYIGVMTDPNDINTFQQLTYASVNTTSWKEFTIPFTNFAGHGNYIAIRLNRTSYATTILMDDLTLDGPPMCPKVEITGVAPSYNGVRLDWEPSVSVGTPTAYEISGLRDGDNYIVPGDATTSQIGGLTPSTQYTVGVRAVCGDVYGEWATTTFRTRTLPCADLSYDDAIRDTVGTSLAGSSYSGSNGAPVYREAGNSVSQSIFLASELTANGSGADTITDIVLGWHGATSGIYPKHLSIYMSHTSKQVFDAGFDSSFWVPTTGTALVYEGDHQPSTTHNNVTYHLQNPFFWDGTSNICVTITMNQPDGVPQSNTGFYGKTSTGTGQYRTLYAYRNGEPYDGANINHITPLARNTYRPDIVFVRASCRAAGTCAPPSLQLTAVTDTAVSLAWTPGYGETSWTVDYRLADAPAAQYTVFNSQQQDTFCTVTGLTPNREYIFRVWHQCDPASPQFPGDSLRVTTPCLSITPSELPYSNNFDNLTSLTVGFTGVEPSCWTMVHRYSSYVDQGPQVRYVTNSGWNHSGSYCLGLWDCCLYAMPEIDTTIRDLTLSLWLSQTSADFSLEVGVLSDPEDASSFVPVDNLHCSTTNVSEPFTVYFSRYTGSGHYIAFRNICSSCNYSCNFIDDLTVDLFRCLPPETPTVSYNMNSQGIAANLSWSNMGTDSYEVSLMDNTYTPIGTPVAVSGTEASIPIPHGETQYYAAVRSLCGSEDNSAWSDTVSIYFTYCHPASTCLDGTGLTTVSFGTEGERVENAEYPTAEPFYGNYAPLSGACAAGTSLEIALSSNTSYDVIVWIDWDSSYTFDADEIMAATNVHFDGDTLRFDIPATQDTGRYRMRIAASGQYGYYNNYVNGNMSAPHDACPQGQCVTAHDYTLHVTPAPNCLPITSITTTDVTDTTATFSCPQLGEGAEVLLNGTKITTQQFNISTTQQLTVLRLNASRNYTVSVRNVCVDPVTEQRDSTAWVTTTFTTLPSASPVVYVKPQPSGVGDGTSWDNALSDINQAIANADARRVYYGTPAEVWVAAGTYYGDTTDAERLDGAYNAFVAKNNINVYGGFAGTESSLNERPQNAVATLDGQNRRRVLYQQYAFNNPTVWDGFTLTGGSDPDNNISGLAAYLRGNMTLSHCEVTGNAPSVNHDGYGTIYITNSTSVSPVIIDHCDIHDNGNTNYNLYYAAIFAGSNATITNTRMHHNIAGGYVLIANYCNVSSNAIRVENCLIDHNTSNSSYVAIYVNTPIYIYNTTVADNSVVRAGINTGSCGGIYSSGINYLHMYNSVVWRNRGTSTNEQRIAEQNLGGSYSTTNFSHNAIEGLQMDSVLTLSADNVTNSVSPLNSPAFVNPDGGDYRLLSTSSLVNAGWYAGASPAATDLAGNSRIYGDTIDIGCYEYHGEQYCPTPSSLTATNITSVSAQLSWNLVGDETPDYYVIEINGNQQNVNVSTSIQPQDAVGYSEYFLTGLSPLTAYTVRIASHCAGESELHWSQPTQFITAVVCSEDTTIVSAAGVSGTSSTNYYPFYSNWGGHVFGQQIYTPEEVSATPTSIHRISYQKTDVGQWGSSFQIWLGHTDRTSFPSSSSFSQTGFVPSDSMTLVYDGTLLFNADTANAWIPVDFNVAPFQYDGTSNLMVAVLGYYNPLTADANFATHHTQGNSNAYSTSFGWGRSSEGYTAPTSDVTTTNYRSNIRFSHSCEASGCTPLALTVSSIGTDSALVMIGTADTANMEVQFKSESQVDWMVFASYEEGTVNGQQGTFTLPLNDLICNSGYEVRVRRICPDGGDGVPPSYHESDWTTVSFSTLPSESPVVYVTPEGAGRRDGTSWDNAMSDLNHAVSNAAARAGHYGTAADVWVAAGTYYAGQASAVAGTGVSQTFVIQPGIKVYGGFAGSETSLDQRQLSTLNSQLSTILDGQNQYRVLTQTTDLTASTAATWDGFTIQNGYVSGNGAGAYLRRYVTLRNCNIRSNRATSLGGGGVYVDISSYSDTTAVIDRCRIEGNRAGYGGGIYGMSCVVTNCLIANNTSQGNCGGVYASYILSSTIVNNHAENNYGAGYASQQFRNNIVWGNRQGATSSPSPLQLSTTPAWCALQEGTGNGMNMTIDTTCIILSTANEGSPLSPCFVAPTNGTGYTYTGGNWQLKDSSVCINAGWYAGVSPADYTDLAGNPRIQHDTIDLGCYESPYSKPTQPIFPDGIVYVTPTGAGTMDGTSWDNAMSDLQQAVDIAYKGSHTVWVAAGTYHGVGENAFTARDGVNVYGGFAGNESSLNERPQNAVATLDGDNMRRVLKQPSSFNNLTTWDGFVLQNGSLSTGDGAGASLAGNFRLRNCTVNNNNSYNGDGGGIYLYNTSQAVSYIENCRIYGNTASGKGGGMYATSYYSTNPNVIRNCRISNNSANRGMGLYIDYRCNVYNSIIDNNSASNGYYAVYAYSNATLVGCDIVDNSSYGTSTSNTAGIGATYNDNYCYNCVIWGNLRRDNVSNIGYGFTFNNCAIEGSTTVSGTGNIYLSSDNDGTEIEVNYPRFIDPAGGDYHIHYTSPLVDAGTQIQPQDAVGYNESDFEGNARTFGNFVDIGAYENNQTSSCPPTITNLQVTALNATGATLTWSDQGGATSYGIQYWREDQPDNVTSITVTALDAAGTTEGNFRYPVTGLSTGFTYKARINSICSDESTSLWSLTVTFSTECDATLLNPLGNVVTLYPADGGNVYDRESFYFRWNSVDNADSYDFYLWDVTKTEPTVPTRSGLTDTTLLYNYGSYNQGIGFFNNHQYNWKVVARDICQSSASSTSSFLYTVCHVVTNLQASDIQATSATISWTDNYGGSSYRLQYYIKGNRANITTLTADATSITLPTLANNRTYIVRVQKRCIEPDGVHISFADSIEFSTLCDPTLVTAPGAFTSITPGDSAMVRPNTSVTLSWVPVENAAYYNIYLWKEPLTDPSVPVEPFVTHRISNNYSITLPTNNLGDTYRWKVEAWNECVSSTSDTHTLIVGGYPNLQVTELSCPSNLIAGQDFTLSWTVTNNGDVATPAGVSWVDRLYIWSEPIVPWLLPAYLLENSLVITPSEWRNLSALDTGESYTRTATVTLPLRYFTGQCYLFVVTEAYIADSIVWPGDTVPTSGPLPEGVYAGSYWWFYDQDLNPIVETGEKHIATNGAYTRYHHDNFNARPVQIVAPPLADLQPTQIVRPSTFFSGTQVTVTATIANNGEAATRSSGWTDALYLSRSPQINDSAVLLSSIRHNASEGALATDDSYEVTFTGSVPRSWYGQAWFYVQTDRYDEEYEYAANGNNIMRSDEVEIILTPPADLVVSSVTAPARATNTQSFNVSYTVSNLGLGVTDVASWKDAVYLCNTPDLASATTRRLLEKVSHSGTLAEGASYTEQRQYDLPYLTDGDSGTYYVIVVTDTDSAVFEYNSEDNNSGVSDSTVIRFYRPYFYVSDIALPDTVVAGREAELTFTLHNGGGKAYNGSLPVKVYYTADPQATGTHGSTPTNATVLSNTSIIAALAANGEQATTMNVTFPSDIGDRNYYIFVDVNSDNSISEVSTDNNMSNAGPYYVCHRTLPDLVVSNLVVPETLRAGDNATISFDVTNNGSNANANLLPQTCHTALTAGGENGYWCPVVTQSQPSDAGTIALAAGGTVHYVQQIMIPPMASGQATLTLVVDASRKIQEENENNNTVTLTRTILPPLFDIAMQSFNVPGSCMTGDTITVTWTADVNHFDSIFQSSRVSYVADATGYRGRKPWRDAVELTPSGSQAGIIMWRDAIYFSNDEILSADDQPVISSDIVRLQVAEGSYSVSRRVPVPSNRSGNQYLLVVADTGSRCIEATRANNLMAQPVSVTQVPLPNLRITSLSVPDSVVRRSGCLVHYSVTNDGPGDIGETQWVDRFFFRNDAVGSKTHFGPLAAGESYSDSVDVVIPSYTPGVIYSFRASIDDGNSIYEGGQEEDNSLSRPVLLLATLPCDLTVSDVTVLGDNNVTIGNTITVQYSIQNIGNNAANGRLKDGIYLSTDNILDDSDVLIGEMYGSVSLAPQGSTERSMTCAVSGIAEGSYYVLVRTNMLAAFEETSHTNNTVSSATPIEVTLPALTIGQAETVTLANGADDIYYRLDVDASNAGQTLSLTLTTDATDAFNAIYLDFGTLPTMARHISSSATPYLQRQQILIPEMQQGTYYILARGSTTSGIQQTATLLADIVNFEIFSVESSTGYNTGSVTVEVTGAKFDTVMDFRLVAADGTVYPASKLHYRNSTKSLVSFELSDVPLGRYAMEAILPGGITTRKENAFTVEEGLPSQLSVSIIAPPAVLNGRPLAANIYYGNNGGTDIHISGLMVISNGHKLSLNSSDFENATDTLFFYTAEPGMDPDIIRPGYSAVQTLYVSTKETAVHGFQVHLEVKPLYRRRE